MKTSIITAIQLFIGFDIFYESSSVFKKTKCFYDVLIGILKN